MQKIKDERLILRNLKNIKIAFIIQTIGILFILFYDFIKNNIEISSSPLWLVLIVSMSVLSFLSINISLDYDRSGLSPKKTLTIGIIILSLVCVAVGTFVVITPGYNISNGLLYGGILFVCGIIPLIYVYLLKKNGE